VKLLKFEFPHKQNSQAHNEWKQNSHWIVIDQDELSRFRPRIKISIIGMYIVWTLESKLSIYYAPMISTLKLIIYAYNVQNNAYKTHLVHLQCLVDVYKCEGYNIFHELNV